MAEKKEDKKEEKEGEAAEGEAKPKSKKMLIIIIAVVVLLAGGGGAAFFLMGSKKPAEGEEGAEHEEEHAHEEEAETATVELEPVIVNLSENASFLKTKIMVEYNIKVVEGGSSHGAPGEGGGGHEAKGGEKNASGLPGILGKKVHIIKDSIIRVLSSKKPGDVLSLEGKDKIKEELLQALNEACAQQEDCVTNIYFIEFIIQ
jgi:flagellar FliL protein